MSTPLSTPPQHAGHAEGLAYWRERWQKKRPLIELGMEDLRLWLHDQASLGLSQLLSEGGAERVRALASRMLNVECKGVARSLEELTTLLSKGKDAQTSSVLGESSDHVDRLLLAFGELSTLSASFERLAHLSFEQRVSLLTTIGLGEMPKSARSKPPLEGRWVCLGSHSDNQEGLLTRRQWLARLSTISEDKNFSEDKRLSEGERLGLHHAERAERLCCVLDFVWGRGWGPGANLPPSAPIGRVLQEPVHSFEGVAPRRALIQPTDPDQASLSSGARLSDQEWASLPWSPSLASAHLYYREALAQTPWTQLQPMLLRGARLVRDEERSSSSLELLIIDAFGDAYPVRLPKSSPKTSRTLEALTLCSRGPLYAVGEWSPEGLTLLTLISERGALFEFS